MNGTMKAWQLTAYGKQNLELVSSAIPAPGPGQILVRVQAVALNYRDKMVIDNGMGMPLALPMTPASDMAGEVVAVGTGVSRFRSGDAVISTFMADWLDGHKPAGSEALGGMLPGMLAEYVLLDQHWAVAAPCSLSATEASTLPCAGLTAWFALIEQGGLKAGDTVVVQGTGGVALFGLQLAVAHGARVIVTSSSNDKLERAKALGAQHGINRSVTPDWAQAVLELTGGKGAEHVLELAGGDNLAASLRAVATAGRISVIGVLNGVELTASVFPLLLKQVTIQGIGVGHRRALEDLVRAVDQSGLKPVIDRVYDFKALPAAVDHLERGAFGKVVLQLA
jgi:NADPH:quinone reductase-like Zn-dependent oxidoreductase